MQIAFLLYEGFTALDVVGPYEVLQRIPGATSFFVAGSQGPVVNDTGSLRLTAEKTLEEVPNPDLLVIGGGLQGTLAAASNPRILGWIEAAHETSRFTCSVCTGSLILAGAGLLKGQTAASHWAAKDHLQGMGVTYTDRRFVRHGRIVTAAGVSAGIDMALYLTAELAGRPVAEVVQLGLEYDPEPPFDSGSLSKAAPEIVQAALASLAAGG